MDTSQLENTQLRDMGKTKIKRSLLYSIPASAFLLFSIISPIRYDHTGVQRVEVGAQSLSEIMITECENEASLAHDRRVLSYQERADKLQNVATATAVVYGVGSIVAGVLTGGWLVAPVAAIGIVEVAWMQSEISSQLSSLTFASSNQLRRDNLECAKSAAETEAELAMLDVMERTVFFDFESGAILTGLSDIPNGRQTKTSATHVGTQ